MLFQGLAYIPIHCNSYSSNSQNVVGTSENPPNLLGSHCSLFSLSFFTHIPWHFLEAYTYMMSHLTNTEADMKNPAVFY